MLYFTAKWQMLFKENQNHDSLTFKKKIEKEGEKLKIVRIPPTSLKNYGSGLSGRLLWGSLFSLNQKCNVHGQGSAEWVPGLLVGSQAQKRNQWIPEKQSDAPAPAWAWQGGPEVCVWCLAVHHFHPGWLLALGDWLLSSPVTRWGNVGCTWGSGVRGMELQLLTEESNARGGKRYRFTHPVDNLFFSGNLSKAGTALLCLKIPMVLASKFRRKNHFTTSGWLSGYPICHLLGHAPSIKTASGTHSFADFISTSKNFHLWQ